MELSYEETMRRIDEYEKTDPLQYKYCRKIKYPYHVDLYLGEKQIIVVPLITSIGWYETDMAWFRQITDLKNAQLIGETVLEAFEHISKSPVDARTRYERDQDSFMKHAVSYKSYKTFNKNYLLCGVILYEDGKYLVSQTRKLEGNNGYGGVSEDLIHLDASATAIDIGNAVMKSFAEMEDFYSKQKTTVKEIPRHEIETLSDIKISFAIPQGDGYTDEEDYGAGEIYQGYSYSKSEDDEPVADMYFGIAAELDCDISADNVKRIFEKQHKAAKVFDYQPVEHSIFEYRAEISNDKIHNIMYLKKMDETEILSCELILKSKSAGKRLSTKIVKDFEKLVESCRVIAK